VKGRTLACLVYNSDFVARNLAPQLPGIFTLGEDANDTLDKIDKAKGGSPLAPRGTSACSGMKGEVGLP